jgi:hypothetical protein
MLKSIVLMVRRLRSRCLFHMQNAIRPATIASAPSPAAAPIPAFAAVDSSPFDPVPPAPTTDVDVAGAEIVMLLAIAGGKSCVAVYVMRPWLAVSEVEVTVSVEVTVTLVFASKYKTLVIVETVVVTETTCWTTMLVLVTTVSVVFVTIAVTVWKVVARFANPACRPSSDSTFISRMGTAVIRGIVPKGTGTRLYKLLLAKLVTVT